MRDLVPVSFTLGRSEVVIQKAAAHAYAVQQMACSQINIGLAEAVTPHVITHSRIHIELRRSKVLWVALHLVGECGLGDRKGNVVLCSPFLSWRRRRRPLECAEMP